MDRRTFMKAAAGTTMLGANPAIAASSEQKKATAWPETVYFDNPIANGLFPLRFVEALPLLVRAQAYTSSYVKDAELFSFTAHEWITDAVLFRGLEIKLKNPSDPDSRKILGSKLSVWVDGNSETKVSDGLSVSAFVGKGGGTFSLWGFPVTEARKVRCSTYLGWANKEGFPEDQFLGYFLPNKTCISIGIEGCLMSSIAVEIKCDMARYSGKK